MAMKIFAAIDIGSYELSMKIFEIASTKGIKLIDFVTYKLAIGTDTYATGKISREKLDELCEVLTEFSRIMKGYKVDDYRACATSAIRETANAIIILDQIKIRTGIVIEVISNSEQRFLDYKAIASKEKEYSQIIGKSTAILDISGGSIQISILEGEMLIITQNMRLGVMRLRERLEQLASKTGQYERLIEEMVNNQFSLFKKLYLKDREIENLIIIDDYISRAIMLPQSGNNTNVIDKNTFDEFMKRVSVGNSTDISRWLKITEESASLLFHSAVLTSCIMEVLGAKQIWAPGVSVCDGIAYEYAMERKLLAFHHDFEQDIIASTATISRRYLCSRKRNEMVEQMALSIFDAFKKVHGMSKRERLLLQIAVQLNDCGKYISQIDVGESSFRIIMATEIIGLSHNEREMIAYIVKYNRDDFEYYENLRESTTLSREAYLNIAKLTAILRIANRLDRSHKQKFKDYKIYLRDNQLKISVNTDEDITLETGLLTEGAAFFEEVYGIKPVILKRRKA